MKKLFYALLIILIPIIYFLGCTETTLNDDEQKVVQKFLVTKWLDVEFYEFAGETIPNELSITFSMKGNKLTYNYQENYYASFGDKRITENGDVEIFYDSGIEGLRIQLLDDKGDPINFGTIKIKEGKNALNKDEILNRMKKQIELREKINSNIVERTDTDLDYYSWSIRCLFSSKLSSRSQNSDYSLTYSHFDVKHTSDDFKEIFIEGFSSERKGGSINWSLREYANPKYIKKQKSKPKSSESTSNEEVDDL